MRAKMIIVALLLTFFASNAATFVVSRRSEAAKHQTNFSSPISVLADNKRPFVLMIGDSITERSKLPGEVCGIPLVKIGIGGSRASAFIPMAEDMNAKSISPLLIVIALGINDANPVYRSDFRASYNLLLDTLPKVPLILATITTVDHSDWLTSMVDKIIRSTANGRSLDIIDLSQLRDFETTDGIHLTERAYVSWNEAIISGIKRAACYLPRWSIQP